jgi:tetraacyldisaccharide 4'-kinase
MHKLRIIALLPFSILYGLLMAFRNFLYKIQVFKSYRPNIPTVVVGNLSMGGTGKSPHIEFLIRHLKNDYQLAVVSRGYGRKTSGFIELSENHAPSDVGDEPLQIKRKFPDIPFAVSENRATAIQQLQSKYPNLELILLDDAMQHRGIRGAFVVLLSVFQKPFFKDWVVPSGSLREFVFLGKKRADLCVYTKCPEPLDPNLKKQYAQLFSTSKPSFFSKFVYDDWHLLSRKKPDFAIEQILLVTGIAYPESLINHLKKNYGVEHMAFGDHHDYQETDIATIHRKFTNFDRQKTCVVCTEKDAIKLRDFESVTENQEISWFYIPIRVAMEQEQLFLNHIHHYVTSYSRGS